MNRAVLLDRDGVINAMVYDPKHGLVDSPANPEQFTLLMGVARAIKTINQMGWLAIVVSNQPGIAKAKFTPALLEAMTAKMHAELNRQSARLDGVYYCLHHPQAVVAEYCKVCECRKPAPGLFFKAARDLAIDLSRSYMVGDGLVDIQAGRAAGCRTILLGSPKCYTCRRMEEFGVWPDYTAGSCLEAVQLIQRREENDEDLSGHSQPF